MPQLYPPPHTQRRHFVNLTLIVATIMLSVFLIDYWRLQPQQGFDQIPTVSPTPFIQPCSNTTASALQRCCQEWAQSHNLLTIQCQGMWYLDAGSCAFRCTASESSKMLTSTPSATRFSQP